MGKGGYRLLKDERFVTEDLVGELRERLRRVDNPEGLVEATKEIDKKCSDFIEQIIKRVDKGRVLDENGSKSKDFKKLGYRKKYKIMQKKDIFKYKKHLIYVKYINLGYLRKKSCLLD